MSDNSFPPTSISINLSQSSFHPLASSMAFTTSVSIIKALLLCYVISLLLCQVMSLSGEGYLEMKRRLKSLNKPAVKTIKTDDGNIYDCVDIYKQPAFDHPLLKNHPLQMNPSSYPTSKEAYNLSRVALDVSLPGGGCPNGTVPLARVTMEQLMIWKNVSNFGKKQVSYGPNTVGPHHYATASSGRGRFYGTRLKMNIWEPKVVDADQFSAAQFWILGHGPNRAKEELNTIEAGWHVYPIFHQGSREARLVTYWTADGYGKTGCYNTLCPGFVQVSKKVGLGTTFPAKSKYEGAQYEIDIRVYLDRENDHNWWLVVENEKIGYWPSTIFKSLRTEADVIQWGGETYTSIEGQSHSPQMGSGHFPEEEWTRACYMRKLQVMENGNYFVTAPVNSMYQDVPGCYRVSNATYDFNMGKYFYFGGPGAICF